MMPAVQDDTFVPTLSVWETLAVATLLRVPGHISKAERHALMHESLQSMGLVKVMHSQVGGLLSGGIFIRGLSGGERRRLNIACGVVGAPAIIFLDEPTTGECTLFKSERQVA
jgi:ATP-binding cassette subfamily G (WHITE) protein 2